MKLIELIKIYPWYDENKTDEQTLIDFWKYHKLDLKVTWMWELCNWEEFISEIEIPTKLKDHSKQIQETIYNYLIKNIVEKDSFDYYVVADIVKDFKTWEEVSNFIELYQQGDIADNIDDIVREHTELRFFS